MSSRSRFVTTLFRHALLSAVGAVIALIACGSARADGASDLAEVFADCSGVWQAVSIMEERIGKPISARRYARLAQGASVSASYLLALDHGARDGGVGDVGGWQIYVEPRTSDARIEMLTLIDREDGARVDQWLGNCAATLETQTQIVELIRGAN